MIFGDPYEFGFQFEVTEIVGDWKYGMCNVIVGAELLPGKGMGYTLGTVINGLKKTFEYAAAREVSDIGNTPVDALMLASGEAKNIVYLDMTELWDAGCALYLGFHGDQERLFYSRDFGKTICEKRLPRGTVEAVIRSLPNPEDI